MNRLSRHGVVAALVVLFVAFSLASPTFLTFANLKSVVVNHFAILSLVSLGMTLVVATGGIDLSIGASVDMASLAYIEVLAQNGSPALAVAAGLAGAAVVGAFNGVLIAGLRVPPFLATLGTLFIAQSVQQLFTDGGTPIYLIAGPPRLIFSLVEVARLWLVGGGILATFLLFGTSIFGRRVLALGVGPAVARYSGLPVRRDVAAVMVNAALLAGVAGIILSSSVRSYAPLSGNAYLLDAIGATFLGTTFSAHGRANVAGTLLGVLLLSIVKNGLLLVGVSFYWQQVGDGALIFLVLALSFSSRRSQ
ncbi:MAG: ABC transporter permease [Roseiarcus sp.]|jgi:ribose transport system permease protein